MCDILLVCFTHDDDDDETVLKNSLCTSGFRMAFWLLIFSGAINRSMTLFISFARATALRNKTNPRKSRRKSRRKVVTELCVSTAIVTVATLLVYALAIFVIPSQFGLPLFNVIAWFFLSYFVVLIIVEMTLASFVLIKLGLRRRNSGKGRTSSYDDFDKLVALVALVFCCTHVLTVIDDVSDLYSVDRHQAMRSRSYYWSLVAGVLNSSVNVFVYLLASRNIRTAFIQSLSKLLFLK